jgi:hypothetical protein
LKNAGFETMADLAEVLDAEGPEGLLSRDGIGPKTVEAIKRAITAEMSQSRLEPAPMSLDDIEAELDRMAREKVMGLLRDLHEAQDDLDSVTSETKKCVQAAETAVSEAKKRIEVIDRKAEKAVDRAITLLGDDAQALVEKTIAARDAELLAAQSEWEAAEQELEAAQTEREVRVSEAEELVHLLQEELDELTMKSTVAARAIEEYEHVDAVVAEAEAFLNDGRRNTGNLMQLAERLSRYASRWPQADRVLADVQVAAETRYARKLRSKIGALTPSPRFPRQLKALVAEADEAGVLDLVQDAVDDARERDRQALAEKGREARLYADEIRENRIGVEEGDLVGYCAGRVVAYRSAGDSQLKVTQAFRWNGDGEKKWLFLPKAVGQVQPRDRVEQRMHLRVVA